MWNRFHHKNMETWKNIDHGFDMIWFWWRNIFLENDTKSTANLASFHRHISEHSSFNSTKKQNKSPQDVLWTQTKKRGFIICRALDRGGPNLNSGSFCAYSNDPICTCHPTTTQSNPLLSSLVAGCLNSREPCMSDPHIISGSETRQCRTAAEYKAVGKDHMIEGTTVFCHFESPKCWPLALLDPCYQWLPMRKGQMESSAWRCSNFASDASDDKRWACLVNRKRYRPPIHINMTASSYSSFINDGLVYPYLSTKNLLVESDNSPTWNHAKIWHGSRRFILIKNKKRCIEVVLMDQLTKKNRWFMVISDDFTEFSLGPSSWSRFLDKIHHINWHKPLTSRHHSSSTFNWRRWSSRRCHRLSPSSRAQSTAWLILSNIFNIVCSCCLYFRLENPGS